jgi:hypothetical protein
MRPTRGYNIKGGKVPLKLGKKVKEVSDKLFLVQSGELGYMYLKAPTLRKAQNVVKKTLTKEWGKKEYRYAKDDIDVSEMDKF